MGVGELPPASLLQRHQGRRDSGPRSGPAGTALEVAASLVLPAGSPGSVLAPTSLSRPRPASSLLPLYI